MFIFIFDFPKLSICVYIYFYIKCTYTSFLTFFKSQGNWSFSFWDEINRSIIFPWGIYKIQEDVIIAHPPLGQPTSGRCSKLQRKHRKGKLYTIHITQQTITVLLKKVTSLSLFRWLWFTHCEVLFNFFELDENNFILNYFWFHGH